MGASAGILMAAGAGITAMGQLQAGRMARLAGQRTQARAQFASQEAEYQAGQVIAESQAAGLEQDRQSELVASRSLAVAAASGGGASDPTVLDVISRTRGEGVYRKMVALYEGQARARQLRIKGTFDELAGGEADLQGRLTESESRSAALGSIIGGAGQATTLYGKYGMKGWNLPDAGGRGDATLLDTGTPSFTPKA